MVQTAPVPLERVQAHIEGEISGQIAVGDRNVQIGSIHGGVVTVNVRDRPQIRPRDRPVSVLPRPFPGLLDRKEALGTFFVESGQQRAETKFFERPPSCATPTPVSPTPTLTATPLPTATYTPAPTPTYTGTPDTVGPSISTVSIDPEFEPGASVYAGPQLSVRCLVVDASGIQQVVLHYWFEPSSGKAEERTVALTPADNLYAAAFGPLEEQGTLRFRIEARDKLGNESTSPIEIRKVVYAVDL